MVTSCVEREYISDHVAKSSHKLQKQFPHS